MMTVEPDLRAGFFTRGIQRVRFVRHSLGGGGRPHSIHGGAFRRLP